VKKRSGPRAALFFRGTRAKSEKRLAYCTDRSSAYSQCLFGPPGANVMSHQPPKQAKKKPLLTPKEKKAIKQQKKHAGDVVPLIRH